MTLTTVVYESSTQLDAYRCAYSLARKLKAEIISVEPNNLDTKITWRVCVKTDQVIVLVTGGIVQEVYNIPSIHNKLEGVLVLDFDEQTDPEDWVSVQEYS